MNSKNYTINESITETQHVQFIIDKSEALEELNNVNLSQYQKAIIFCDEKLKENWWLKLRKLLKQK